MMTDTDGSTARPDDQVVEAIREAVAVGMTQVMSDLTQLVRIPSVSAAAFDPAHVEASARYVAELLGDLGLDVELYRGDLADGTPGAPAVIARRIAEPGRPTILLYAHHDVQPPGEGWSSDPFEPTMRAGRLYGRGAADDKAGIAAHIGALRALENITDRVGDVTHGVGITIFVEGEEEVGSPSFTDLLARYGHLLAADAMVVADSVNWKVGVPALTTSLRGLVDVTVSVSVLDQGVHSGMFGGPVIDAVTALARLIATLHTDDGDVAVTGLVSSQAAPLDYPEGDFRRDAFVLPEVTLVGTDSLVSRLWTRPAISVLGIDAPTIAQSSNTLVPHASARISMRIAPGQEPEQALAALTDHLQQHAPFGASVSVTCTGLGPAFQAPLDSPAMAAARWSFAQAWGTDPVDTGIGGSIPFVADLQRTYPEAAILITGVEDPESRAHGVDESVHVGELSNVITAEALLVCALAAAYCQ